MKTKILLTFCMVALSWAISAQTTIVGRWEVADDSGQSKLQFNNDQTLLMTDGDEQLLFTYEANYNSTPIKVFLTLIENEEVKMYGILEFISENQVRFCLDMTGSGYPDNFEPVETVQSVIMNRMQ